jgi:hypothetical protein
MKRTARFLAGLVALGSLGCAAGPRPAAAPAAPAPTSAAARFTILQINDVYKIEGLLGGTVGGLAREFPAVAHVVR